MLFHSRCRWNLLWLLLFSGLDAQVDPRAGKHQPAIQTCLHAAQTDCPVGVLW